MHAEVRSAGRGDCSICGIIIEAATAREHGDTEDGLADLSHRLNIGNVCVCVYPAIGALEMSTHMVGHAAHRYLAPAFSAWLRFAIATLVLLGQLSELRAWQCTGSGAPGYAFATMVPQPAPR